MKIIGLIPARSGSKGIPGKNLKLLGDLPLLAHTCIESLKSKVLDNIIISTDSQKIADVAMLYGVDAPFLRPPDISGDSSSASEYVEHFLGFLKSQEQSMPEVIVILQPTCPFRVAQDIDNATQLLLDSNLDCITSVNELPSKYNPAWQFKLEGLNLQPYGDNKDWSSIVKNRQLLESTFTRNGAIYAFRVNSFLKNGNIYGSRVGGYKMPIERSINIDEPEDWIAAERYLIKLEINHE